jgi:hypothetical protein
MPGGGGRRWSRRRGASGVAMPVAVAGGRVGGAVHPVSPCPVAVAGGRVGGAVHPVSPCPVAVAGGRVGGAVRPVA